MITWRVGTWKNDGVSETLIEGATYATVTKERDTFLVYLLRKHNGSVVTFGDHGVIRVTYPDDNVRRILLTTDPK